MVDDQRSAGPDPAAGNAADPLPQRAAHVDGGTPTDLVEEASLDSFPASDPPPWSDVSIGPPQRFTQSHPPQDAGDGGGVPNGRGVPDQATGDPTEGSG